MENKKTIENLFNEFIKVGQPLINGDAEKLRVMKGMYFASVGHFLMENVDFILGETDSKKIIKHMQMVDEIQDFMKESKKEIESLIKNEPHEKY